MKKSDEKEHWYFVDETGDPTFHDGRGSLIVGQEGCSPILGVGFIETSDPAPIRRALAELHEQIAGDEYLQAFPSIEKTNWLSTPRTIARRYGILSTGVYLSWSSRRSSSSPGKSSASFGTRFRRVRVSSTII